MYGAAIGAAEAILALGADHWVSVGVSIEEISYSQKLWSEKYKEIRTLVSEGYAIQSDIEFYEAEKER